MTRTADALTLADEHRRAVEERSKCSWPDFVDRVFALDERFIDEGVRPAARPLRITEEINRAAGRVMVITGQTRDPISDAVHELLRIAYGQRALGMGPIHVGVVMLRDAFIPFYVPGGYGTFRVNPWDFVDRLPANLPLLTSLAPADVARANDQIFDVWDFGWAVTDLRAEQSEASRLLVQSRDQIESACMTIQGSFSQRIALQGTAYAVELAAKGVLSRHRWSEKDLRKLGHDLPACVHALCDAEDKVDRGLASYAASQIPPVVDERYATGAMTMSRREIGDVVGFGQYLLGEVGRTLSDRNIRAATSPLPARVFPVLPAANS